MARRDPVKVMQQYEQAKQLRQNMEPDWRISSAYCLPRHYNTWSTDGPPQPGNAGGNTTKRIAYDSTAAKALPKYAAVLERIATPHNMIYQNLVASDTSLQKNRRVREYLEALRDLIFKYRYGQKANFGRSTSETFMSMGAYGTAPVFLGQRTPNALFKGKSFIYKAMHLKNIFILINDEGEVVAVFRRFWLNKRQYIEKFGLEAPMPPSMQSDKGVLPREDLFHEFVHYCAVRGEDHDPEALDARRHPICSEYICVKDKMYVTKEAGYRSMPYLTPRTSTEPDNPYGFAPAVAVQGSMGTASQIKKTSLKVGQKIADPVLLTYDDGVLNGQVDLRPGASNPGGLDKQGRELVKPLTMGNLQVIDKMLEDERNDINDSFFVTLFQTLIDRPEMTAAEVYEHIADRAAQLAPTMGAVQDEYIAPCTMREVDLLQEMGLVAEGPNMPGLQMPPELIEAKGEYELVYTSPMAKGMYAEETSGFMRSVEMSMRLAEATQDPSHLDHYDFDTAIPEISDNMNVPARWMNDDKKKKNKRAEREEKMKQAQLMQNAGQLASAAKNVSQIQEQGK